MELLTELLSYYKNLKTNYQQEDLVALLRDIQDTFGCISLDTQTIISQELGIGLPLIRTIIKQYPSLKELPSNHRITVCTGHNCRQSGCTGLLERIEQEIGVAPGETTTDGHFMVETQCCLKHCSDAPNLTIDEELHSHVTKENISTILKRYN